MVVKMAQWFISPPGWRPYKTQSAKKAAISGLFLEGEIIPITAASVLSMNKSGLKG